MTVTHWAEVKGGIDGGFGGWKVRSRMVSICGASGGELDTDEAKATCPTCLATIRFYQEWARTGRRPA